MNRLGAQLWMTRTPYGLKPEGGTLGGCGCQQLGQVGQPKTNPVVAGLGGLAAGFLLGWFVFGASR